MILADVDTWPAFLRDYLASQHEMLLAYAHHERERMDAYLHPENEHVPMALMPSNPHLERHEAAWLQAQRLLYSTFLRGWHCTRLTDDEVEHIRAHGMQPPNPQILAERIRRVQTAGMIDGAIAERLIAENQAGERYRQGMIWFCFFEPRSAGQSGIERFFRSWGGEALYNSHERDPKTGAALRSIGSPCLIEADVPVSSFGCHSCLGQKIIRRYLLTYGVDTGESWEHEDTSASSARNSATHHRYARSSRVTNSARGNSSSYAPTGAGQRN